MHRLSCSGLIALLAALLSAGTALAADSLPVAGISAELTITYDNEGNPHILAANDLDASFAQGYTQAADRFFQMDFTRRLASGTLAELLGPNALDSDIQLRTLGLRRAAYESLFAFSEETRGWLQAYANGVNAYLKQHPLPPEYAALELSEVDPWTPVDSVVVGKALAFNLSFDLDIDLTLKLGAYQAAGAAAGIDGTALFFFDTHRTAPADGRISMPNFMADHGIIDLPDANKNKSRRAEMSALDPQTLRLARDYKAKIAAIPFLAQSMQARDGRAGSNLWAVSAEHSSTGNPLVANDPHLSLNTPPVWVEDHLQSNDPHFADPLDAIGVAVPGVPGIVQGCTTRLCWGSTVHPLDTTDTFQEQLKLNTFGLPTDTVYKGQPEPILYVFQSYYVNQIGDGIPDNLQRAPVGYTEGAISFLVPRRNYGPLVVVDVDAQSGLSVQYTGWGATHEIEAFREINRAGNMEEFQNALTLFDFGSQNFVYADVDGNIAQFTGAEMPLRTDLQTMNTADGGVPPWIIRDGTGALAHGWLPVETPQTNQATPYQLLPLDEMPHLINPARGYVANANNDNVGTSLDNNALDQVRPEGGLYYLNPGYSDFRMGRIDRKLAAMTASGRMLSPADMQALQANNQLMDAEVAMPFILEAFADAQDAGAWGPLAALAADPGVAEAAGRLATWDFSTPTGIQAGYDPGDDPNNLPQPSQQEIDASVAATLYAVWRSQAVRNIIDTPLSAIGLGAALPDGRLALTAMLNKLQAFPVLQGIGGSGFDFFPVPGAPDRASARDFMLLKSLRDALDLLAGDAFAPAFAHSTMQDDYRWGKLHRIVFDHVLGGPFNIPNGGGFSDLGADLPGVSRAGGFQSVDAASHDVRAASANAFMFGSGPSRRFVGDMNLAGINLQEILPGGRSGIIGHPDQANQMGRWLTNQYKPLLNDPAALQAAAVQSLELVPLP